MAAARWKATARKNVETQTEVLRTHERKAAAKKNMETQTEVPKQDASVQVSGCSECQSLAFAMLDERDSTCVKCDQQNDLLSLVVDLKEKVERLKSIKECEREIDNRQPAEAPHRACHLLPPCKQVIEAGRQCSYCSKPSPPPSNNIEESGNVGQWQKAPTWRCRCTLPEILLPPSFP